MLLELIRMGIETNLWDPSHLLSSLAAIEWSLLAQQFETDVFAATRTAFANFIESGQVWALLIGVVLGYLLRGITTYN